MLENKVYQRIAIVCQEGSPRAGGSGCGSRVVLRRLHCMQQPPGGEQRRPELSFGVSESPPQSASRTYDTPHVLTVMSKHFFVASHVFRGIRKTNREMIGAGDLPPFNLCQGHGVREGGEGGLVGNLQKVIF